MIQRLPDKTFLLVLFALSGSFAWRFVDWSVPPYEDAAMLMRYAGHLAEGHGIVWNVGEPPLDGATDFLFVVLVAAVVRAGVTVEAAVRGLTLLAHFGLIGLIYAGMRHVQRSGAVPAFLSALYVAVGPGFFLSAAYFGTTIFGLAVVGAWFLAQRLIVASGRTVRAYVEFAGACLLAGLVRPEGVLISSSMLAAVCLLMPANERRRLVVVFAGVFLLFGGPYFLWRWQYFGHFLPNPYYKKGAWRLHLMALRESAQTSFAMALPFMPAFLLAIRSKEGLRKVTTFLIPIVCTTAMWGLISDEMNFGHRFQYPILLLCAGSWYPLVRELPEEWALPRFRSLSALQKVALVVGVSSLASLVILRQASRSQEFVYARDGRLDVGILLSRYVDRGYTIATTEAGLLPLYSKWRAIDTWGLNDRWIAENGSLTEDYLSRQRPDVVMWHQFPTTDAPPEFGESWLAQVITLRHYVERHGFTLAAAFGTRPDDVHYYYVRSDLPDRSEIVRRIRSSDYRSYQTGERCTNFAGTDAR